MWCVLIKWLQTNEVRMLHRNIITCNAAVVIADGWNRINRNDPGRYFVVHESELEFFGLK